MKILQKVRSIFKKHSKKKIGSKILFYTWCLLYSVMVFFPFVVLILTSFTSAKQIYSSLNFTWFPKPVSFEAYTIIFTQDPIAIDGIPSILRGFINTLWMSLLTVIVGLLVSSLAAYVYSKFNFKGKETLFTIQIATMMIPAATLTIPKFVFYESIGWTNTVLPIIIPGMFGGASAIFFFRAFFSGISNDYLEAAKVDGLSDFSAFFRIIIPLSVPAFVAQFIFSFVANYNSFMAPLLYLQYDDRMMTLQLAVNTLQGIFTDANQICAIALLALLPLIILYLFSQRLFIEGISAGGIKE